MDDDSASAKRYRQRAAEVRAKAEKMTSPDLKRSLMDIARTYDHLAARIEAGSSRTS
jgi:hypothetical protein